MISNIDFVLRFYGPVNPMGSCRARSVYLTTRLLGRLYIHTDNPLYTDIRYNDTIHYNDNLSVTKPSPKR